MTPQEPFKMSRQDVFKLIDGERAYQNARWHDETARTVSDERVLITVFLRKAQDAYAAFPGTLAAMDCIRKIAAIGVRCMEENPTKFRSMGGWTIGWTSEDRSTVFEAIESERNYQDKHRGLSTTAPIPPDSRHTVGDWLGHIEEYMSRLCHEIYSYKYDDALETVRKITALCVAAMEHIPTPPRAALTTDGALPTSLNTEA
jgi:hypothetical protein